MELSIIISLEMIITLTRTNEHGLHSLEEKTTISKTFFRDASIQFNRLSLFHIQSRFERNFRRHLRDDGTAYFFNRHTHIITFIFIYIVYEIRRMKHNVTREEVRYVTWENK